MGEFDGMVAFGRTLFPCGHVDDWSGTPPDRHGCELEARLSEIERRLGIAHDASLPSQTIGYTAVDTLDEAVKR